MNETWIVIWWLPQPHLFYKCFLQDISCVCNQCFTSFLGILVEEESVLSILSWFGFLTKQYLGKMSLSGCIWTENKWKDLKFKSNHFFLFSTNLWWKTITSISEMPLLLIWFLLSEAFWITDKWNTRSSLKKENPPTHTKTKCLSSPGLRLSWLGLYLREDSEINKGSGFQQD